MKDLMNSVWHWYQDLTAILGRVWFVLRGKSFHYCPDCTRNRVCHVGIREQIQRRSEEERKARLAASSASNDLLTLREAKRYKSVGLVILAFMVVAGTVEAGEKIYRTWPVQDSDSMILLECDEGYKNCKGPLLVQNSCYQRMQELLLMLDQHLDRVRLTGDYERRLLKSMVLETFSFEKKRQWYDTMQACVTGK